MRQQDRAYDDLMRQLATVLAWVVMALVMVVLYFVVQAVVAVNTLLLQPVCVVVLVTSAPYLAQRLQRHRIPPKR